MRTSSAFNQPRETGFTHKPKPSPDSWWLGKSQPESGCAVVNREKEFTGTVIGPSLKVRGSRLRRANRDQVGYREAWAKVVYEKRGEGAKVGEADDASNIAASNRNERPIEEAPILAIPNSTPTDQAGTDDKVAPTWRSIKALGNRRLGFTVTTPFRATGKAGHHYEITWSRLRNAYILTVDGETRAHGRLKVEAFAAANEIEINLPDPPANAEGAE